MGLPSAGALPALGLTVGRHRLPDARISRKSAVAYVHTCALRPDGTPMCWGGAGERTDWGQASPPPGERFVDISNGLRSTCGLREDGSHVCWRFGLTGEPPEGVSSQGLKSVSDANLSSLSAGDRFTYALNAAGTPVCWGIDDYGQASPAADERFAVVSSGARHACGLRDDGEVVCWGDDGQGRASPPLGTTFKSISSGWAYTAPLVKMVSPCAGDVTATAKPRRLKANGSRPSAAAESIPAPLALMVQRCAGA